MSDSGALMALMVGILAGAFMAFGLVLVVMFFGSPDTCRAAVYSLAQMLL